jgi:predicted Zn-dependent peptidase
VTLVGDLDEQTILEGFDARVQEAAGTIPQSDPVEEHSDIFTPETTLRMDVGTSSFLVGIKDPCVLPSSPLDGLALVERKLAGRLITESLLGPSSFLFSELFSQGVLNDSFGFQYVCERDFAYLVAGGESDRPAEAAERLLEAFRKACGRGMENGLFEMQKRVAAGDFLRSMDQIRSCGMAAARAALDRVDLFEYPAVYDRIDARQAMDAMRFMADQNQTARVYVERHSEEGTP